MQNRVLEINDYSSSDFGHFREATVDLVPEPQRASDRFKVHIFTRYKEYYEIMSYSTPSHSLAVFCRKANIKCFDSLLARQWLSMKAAC